MRSWLLIVVLHSVLLSCTVAMWAQSSNPNSSAPANSQTPDSPSPPAAKPSQPHNPNLTPPRSDRVNANDLSDEPGESSSKDEPIDLSPPVDDAKAHPQSSDILMDAEG